MFETNDRPLQTSPSEKVSDRMTDVRRGPQGNELGELAYEGRKRHELTKRGHDA